MSWIGWLKLTAATLALLVLALFVTQNMGRTTALSLDVHFAAWRFSQPVAIPVLMGVCMAIGALGAGAWGWARARSATVEAERLRDELAVARARASTGNGGDWARRPASPPSSPG